MNDVYRGEYRVVGSSPAISMLQSLIRDAASTDMNVLILGETGVGKELVARNIHDASSRRDGKYVPINCAAIPEGLLESELFGYRRGAFTSADLRGNPGAFKYAEGGTVFLDEILDMAPLHQAKLLRFLQQKEVAIVGNPQSAHVDIKVVAGTNRDLEYELRHGGLRRDLYYRLNGFTIEVPPLRERLEDIPELVSYFIAKYNQLGGTLQVSPQVIETFRKHNWPGNIRELENYVRRALLDYQMRHQSASERPKILTMDYFKSFKDKKPLDPEYAGKIKLMPEIAPLNGNQSDNHEQLSLKRISKQAKDEAEAKIIRGALEKTNWNRAQAARLVGISYKAFLYKLKKLVTKS